MPAAHLNAPAHPAVIARHAYDPDAAEEYLVLGPNGVPTWTADLRGATAFASMREATRAALRLPGAGRAFGLPLSAELAVCGVH